MAKKNIAVIGGGALGVSLARCLAQLGANVTLFERHYPGAGTTTTSYAWINSNGKAPYSYHQLNVAGMEEHVKLQQESRTDGRWLIQSGTYEWAVGQQDQEQLAQRVARLLKDHYPAREVAPGALKTLLPELRLDPRAGSLWHFPSECLLHPVIYLAHQWSQARELGAELYSGAEVVDISEHSKGVTLSLSDGRRWQGDSVVMATGRWSQELMERLGIPLAMTDANRADKLACGFLATTNPLCIQLQANLITPGLNIRPQGGGRLLLQSTDLDDHASPVAPAAAEGFIGQEMLRRLGRLFDHTEQASIERLAVGQRSRPADGLPAIGYVTPLRRVYLMVTHSGITLAPILGRLTAQEVLSDHRPALLADFSPQRLLHKSADDFAAPQTPYFPAAQ